MLTFWSSANEHVSSTKAMESCLAGSTYGQPGAEQEVLFIHTTMGHNFAELIATAQKAAPKARIFGCTGCGVIGAKEFVSEKARALAVMGLRGSASDLAIASSERLSFATAYPETLQVAQRLKSQNPGITSLLVVGGFTDFVADGVFAAIAEVFGADLPVFGWTSTDNLKGLGSNQFVDGRVVEHGLILIGFADPSLQLTMGVHHGNTCVGTPFTVTKAAGNRILALDGKAAYPAVMERLGMAPDTPFEAALRVVCFGMELPPELHQEYGNRHILYVPVGTDARCESFAFAVDIPEGTRLWLTQRDESLMFSGLKTMTEDLVRRTGGQPPVAVFHSDCAARGRMSFDQIQKGEIIHAMQAPLARAGAPPWLGLYGYGELTPLGGTSYFHNQTTSLYVLTRR